MPALLVFIDLAFLCFSFTSPQYASTSWDKLVENHKVCLILQSVGSVLFGFAKCHRTVFAGDDDGSMQINWEKTMKPDRLLQIILLMMYQV